MEHPGTFTHKQVQNVRLFDVIILGPLMLSAGLRRPFPSDAANLLLAVSGVLTTVFNFIRMMEHAE